MIAQRRTADIGFEPLCSSASAAENPISNIGHDPADSRDSSPYDRRLDSDIAVAAGKTAAELIAAGGKMIAQRRTADTGFEPLCSSASAAGNPISNTGHDPADSRGSSPCDRHLDSVVVEIVDANQLPPSACFVVFTYK